ncbi:MAG: DUF6438 domain-containing protein [Flavobacteriales bacterium]|jgi:hypothetical protein
MRIALFIACILVLFSCKKKEGATAPTTSAPVQETPVAPVVQESQQDSLLYEYKRGACFGTCPIFNLKIYQNGYAVYEGRNHVQMIGTYHSTMNAATLLKLAQVVDEIKYFSLKDEYDFEGIQDIPAVYSTVVRDGVKKQIKNRYQGPSELKLLYAAFDEAVSNSKWTLE